MQKYFKNLQPVVGRVIKIVGKNYFIEDENKQIIKCTLKGKMRLDEYSNTNPVVVGDYVTYEKISEKDGVIVDLKERKNYIIRKSVKLSNPYQIIAANIDCAYIITTLIEPEVKLEFIDRFLVTCEAYRVPAAIILNKIDLYENLNAEVSEFTQIYENAGYKIYKTSAKTGKGINEVKEALINKTNLFCGSSGVGKSSIINAIIPHAKIKVQELSKYHKQGVHTTTFIEMHKLNEGGYIIDTPGLRSFGFYEINKYELFHFFPEILRETQNCKYKNCTHIWEPDCAVKKAIENNKISKIRYRNYLNMFFDEGKKYR
ncbi:MAG: ribosome small subunit-dependent GTPase A [Bacteroidales bacterium]|nr:ribosome small subunit-dependent GTPase A [Bacteroidales bacterium]